MNITRVLVAIAGADENNKHTFSLGLITATGLSRLEYSKLAYKFLCKPTISYQKYSKPKESKQDATAY